MAKTVHVELRKGEDWNALTGSFLAFSMKEKGLKKGGCMEGDPDPALPGDKSYAALSIPDHSPHLIDCLREWAEREQRDFRAK